MPRKVFVAGEILTASDVNTQLMDQAVMRFADSTARGSAIPSPTEGMTTYLDDLNRIEVYNGSAWGPVGTILQVVSTTKTDTFSTTSDTLVDVTGLSATITPSSTASKILVICTLNIIGDSTNNIAHAALLRGSTAIFLGDAAGSRSRVSHQAPAFSTGSVAGNIMHLDSPATSSATTYKIQARRNTAAGTIFVNRAATDTDAASVGRLASSITLLEVAG